MIRSFQAVHFNRSSKVRYRKWPLAFGQTQLAELLVENSIRHGIDPQSHAVRVTITAERDGSDTRVQIRDRGRGLAQGNMQKGTGISNTAERLQHLYGPRHKLQFENCEDGGLLVTVAFPYQL